ncbi:vomeronasal type-2 receptor 26-like [Rana temporaria]|uniref:vomeronasal type-2 receptor 26-like n=1 Tax=Rana temporaria TaxID=8407 RepID=UPI001AADCFE6|nr:vomeronasal type-2 receptor 26-like [Rana temporaria]
MVILYLYIFQFCLMPQCVTLWRSGMESPACSLKLSDVIDEFEYFQDGDLIIGGVLTLRSKIEYLALIEEKTYSSSVRYYVNLLAFLYAIDNINQDPDILPNITLGFHLYDSWLEPKKGVQSVLQILSGPNGTVPNYSCKGQGKLAGVIGDQYSSTTIPIAEILGLYRYTQVSYGATDYSLSDRLLYPHVFRTVQNDHVCYFGIAKLVKHFGWNWVGILFSDDDTGETETQILKRHLASQEICVAFEKRITVNHAAMDQWTDTLHEVNCKVLILCGSFTSNAQTYIVEYTRINKNNILILPPAWTLEKIQSITFYQSFITSLHFKFFDLQILRNTNLFDEDLLSKGPQVQLLLDDLTVTLYNITSTQNGKNIYFQKCTTSSDALIRLTLSMSGKQTLYGESLQVYFAVEAMAEAIHYFTKINRSFNINRFKQSISELFKASGNNVASSKMARSQPDEDDFSEDSQYTAEDSGRSRSRSNKPLTFADMSVIAADIKATFSAAITDLKSNLLVLSDKMEAVEVKGKQRDRAIRRLEKVVDTHASHFIEINHHLEDLDNRGRRCNIRVMGIPESVESDQIVPALQRVFNSLLERQEDTVIDFVRAHRALRARGPDDAPPRDIICCLQSFPLKEDIMRKARGKQAYRFQWHGYYVVPGSITNHTEKS